jgi:hypothetical protein
MKTLILGFLTIVSLNAFAGLNCTTSESEVLKISPVPGKLYSVLEKSGSGPYRVDIMSRAEMVTIVSRENKNKKVEISLARQTLIGTAKIEGRLSLISCEMFY